MITNPASHDYPLVHQVSSFVRTQTEVIGQYTHDTINAHPIIVASTVIVALTAGWVSVIYETLAPNHYKLCTNRETSNPFIATSTVIVAAASTAIVASLATLVVLALAACHYKLPTNREESK